MPGSGNQLTGQLLRMLSHIAELAREIREARAFIGTVAKPSGAGTAFTTIATIVASGLR
jgi:hypothetical protein